MYSHPCLAKDDFNNIQNKNSTSVLRHFATSQQTKPPNTVGSGTVDTNTLVKSVVNDMVVAEKGGQWLLSCYAPYKETPAFPGFEDQSFEEVRFGYYEALKNGTVEQYKQQIQMVLQQAMLKLKSLQSPSPDIVNILKSIYTSPPSSQSGVYGSNTISTSNVFSNATNTSGQPQPSTFGQQQNSSIFAQANQNVFGNKNPQSQNNYGGAPNIFGGNVTQNSIFGGQAGNAAFGASNIHPQPQNSNQSIFRQANVNSAAGGSIFGGQASSMHPGTIPLPGTNIFNNTQSINSSIFGGHEINTSLGHVPQQNPQQISAPFIPQAQPGTTNIFAKQPTAIFANQNTGSAFGQPAPQTFGNTMESPIFEQKNVFLQPNQPHISIPSFNQQPKTSLEVPSQSNVFGNKQLTGSSNLVSNQMGKIDEIIYSKLEDLTEEERKWFESDDLDIFNIPEKPPPYQMCFKT